MILLYEPFFQTPADQKLITHRCEQARCNCKGALGFLPLQAYEQAVKKRRMLVAAKFDDYGFSEAFVGFAIWSQTARQIKILQLFVEEDWRRQRIGTRLVRAAEKFRKETDWSSLRVRSDFEDANRFWRSIGYGLEESVDDSNKKGIPINVYQRNLKPLKGKRS